MILENKPPSTEEWLRSIYTMEYYSAMKGTKLCHLQRHGWTKRLSQSEVRKRKISMVYQCLYMESRRNDTEESICKAKIET